MHEYITISKFDVAEEIRLVMKDLEDSQRNIKVGIYKDSAIPDEELDEAEVR